MRSLIFIILAAFAAYSGWWFYGQNLRQTLVAQWLEDRREEGWVADAQYQIKGYPNRFDSVFSNVVLSNPDRGWAWQTKEFNIAQLSYRPNHLIAIWPAAQEISGPNQMINIAGDNLRASVILQSPTSDQLERAVIEGQNINANSSTGWSFQSQSTQLAIRKTMGIDNEYTFDLDGTGFKPQMQWLSKIDNAGAFDQAFDRLRAKIGVLYTAPIALRHFENAQLSVQRYRIDNLNIIWAGMELRATGELVLDQGGFPSGQLRLDIKNWQQMVDLAVKSNAIDAALAGTIESGLSLIAALSGNKDQLKIPLNFTGKQMRLGPVPIGPAPSLRLL